MTADVIPMRLGVLLLAWMAVVPGSAFPAETPPQEQAVAACSCRADFDSLAAKLERNYIAFPLETSGKPREADYRRLVADLRRRAGSTADSACIFLLRELTDWFRDGHLFVFQAPRLSPEESDRLEAAAERRNIDESEFRADLARRSGRLDPIEGIWYTPGYRVAILPAARGNDRDFVAVTLASDSLRWKPGFVKARFTRMTDGSYRTIFYADDHGRRDIDMRIYRNTLLAAGATTWGKEFPLAPHEVGTLDPKDPRRPTVRLAGTDAVVVSVPSHDPAFRAPLDSLVNQYRSDILSRPILIIDIRGDLGGGSQTTGPLVPFLVSREQKPPIGPRGLSMVLSSPDNIRYFGRGWNPDSVAQRMMAAPGQVLPLMRAEELGMPFPNATVHPLPSRVAVLMDRGVASAGEAFVLQARRSTKVTLFGENTYGIIDYQSVNIVSLACRARGTLFGYPMIAASSTLPVDGLNREGIPPDVRGVDADNPVPWIIRYLNSRP
jgi:hypothetical protein